MKSNTTSNSVYVPARTVRTMPANTDQQSLGSAKPAPAQEPSVPSGSNAPESDIANEEGICCIISLLQIIRISTVMKPF